MGSSSSGKGGSKQKQSTTQTNAPPAWALPLYKQGAGDAMQIYNSGKGGNVYQGQRVGDLGQGTRNAIGGMNNVAGGFNNPAFRNILNGGTASGNNLGDMANGKLVGNNPYFNQALQNTLDNTASTINSQFSGAGRYGSGANNAVLGNTLGNVATNAMASQYNQDVQNQLHANQQIDAANQGFLGAGAGFLGNQSNAWANALRGNQMLDQNAQDRLNADWQKWTEEDNRDWNRLGFLQNAANGFSGNYGTQSGTSRSQGGKGSWQLADNDGILGGLFGKSDIRAKENIAPAGEKNGFRLYDFSYIGQPARYRGVMAQDILETHPSAVHIDPADGLYCVDYAQLGLKMERLDFRL